MDGVNIKPTLYLSSKDLPEIKNWKIGESYDLILSVKLTDMHLSSNGAASANFEIDTAMAAEKDPNLEDINNMEDPMEFGMAAAKYREKNS